MSLLSCQNDDNNDCCINVESDVLIQLENSEELDLLNPLSPNSIDSENIQIKYQMENGEKKLVNDPNLDAPKGFYIVPPNETQTENYSLQLFLNTDYIGAENTSQTFIEWSSTDMDKIKSEFIRDNNNLLVSKIWVNDELSWERTNPQTVLIIK